MTNMTKHPPPQSRRGGRGMKRVGNCHRSSQRYRGQIQKVGKAIGMRLGMMTPRLKAKILNAPHLVCPKT